MAPFLESPTDLLAFRFQGIGALRSNLRRKTASVRGDIKPPLRLTNGFRGGSVRLAETHRLSTIRYRHILRDGHAHKNSRSILCHSIGRLKKRSDSSPDRLSVRSDDVMWYLRVEADGIIYHRNIEYFTLAIFCDPLSVIDDFGQRCSRVNYTRGMRIQTAGRRRPRDLLDEFLTGLKFAGSLRLSLGLSSSETAQPTVYISRMTPVVNNTLASRTRGGTTASEAAFSRVASPSAFFCNH